MSTANEYYATGKRKTSIARVRISPGTGEIHLNQKTIDDYFGGHEALKLLVRQPFAVTEMGDKFDILATVAGGGVNGQAGAVRLGIARALVTFNAELRKQLKKDGLLTSDSRVKERKKYGLAGARKRFQFSKR